MVHMDETEKAERIRVGRWAHAQVENLDGVIAHIEATPEDSWRVDTVRSADGSTNCFFGHLFNMGANDDEGSALWDAFESRWATTYRLYPINDGKNPSYAQETPKQRVLAFLNDLRDGKVMSTEESMEACYQDYLTEQAGKAAEGIQEAGSAVTGVPA